MKAEEFDLPQNPVLRQVPVNHPTYDLARKRRGLLGLTLNKLLTLITIFLFSLPTVFAQVSVSDPNGDLVVTVKTHKAPPPIPEYIQPESPGDGYYWTPGYWAWANDDYYWVPGVWVMPPAENLLWTPGYWGFEDDVYGWYPGYWGDEIGYYGGIDYGFGYYGNGFYGGRWDHDRFMYNTSVWHVGKNAHNTYNEKVDRPHDRDRASFNGKGGVTYRPNDHEMKTIANRMPANGEQRNHEINMAKEKGQFHAISAKPAVHSMVTPSGQRFDERGQQVKAMSVRSGPKGMSGGNARGGVKGGGEQKGGKR